MGNGLTLTALLKTSHWLQAEDESTVGFSYAMDALTVGYTTIKPGTVAGSDSLATSGISQLNTQLAHWLHHSQSTKLTRQQ